MFQIVHQKWEVFHYFHLPGRISFTAPSAFSSCLIDNHQTQISYVKKNFWFIAIGISATMILLVYTCVKFCNSYSHDRVHRGFSIKLNSEVKFPLRITECQADKYQRDFHCFGFFFPYSSFHCFCLPFFNSAEKKCDLKLIQNL